MLVSITQEAQLDCTYANCDILGSSEEPVDQNTHEGRIETELDWKQSELGISHTLRHNYATNGDTWTCELSYIHTKIIKAQTYLLQDHHTAIASCSDRSSE